MTSAPQFRTALARDSVALRAAQRLRYEVFVEELGASGPMVDHAARLEIDRFDPFFDHLILYDGAAVVGVYRMLRGEQARAAGQYYSEDEFDLSPLRASDRRLMELGRSCLHPAYRGGPAMYHLWSALARYIAEHRIEILFGAASFAGADITAHRAPLSLLHRHHLAPSELRVKARESQPLDLVPEAQLDRRKIMVRMPSLIKAYLRLGGVVGDGAFIDTAFNTTDICLILDTATLNARQQRIYAGHI